MVLSMLLWRIPVSRISTIWICLLACLLNIQRKTLVGCCGCMQTVSPENGNSKTIGILWSWSYWSTFILTWYVSGMVSSLFWLFLLMVHNTHKPCIWSWMHWILSVGLLHLMFVFELFHNGFHHFSRIQTVGILFIFGCGVNRRLWYHEKPDWLLWYMSIAGFLFPYCKAMRMPETSLLQTGSRQVLRETSCCMVQWVLCPWLVSSLWSSWAPCIGKPMHSATPTIYFLFTQYLAECFLPHENIVCTFMSEDCSCSSQVAIGPETKRIRIWLQSLLLQLLLNFQ